MGTATGVIYLLAMLHTSPCKDKCRHIRQNDHDCKCIAMCVTMFITTLTILI